MTPQSISTAAAVLLSLAFSYIPNLSDWYAKLDGVRKRLVMLCLLVAAALSAFVLACSGHASAFGLTVTCDEPGAIALLQSLVLAVMANQSAYLITPRRSASR